METTTTNTNDDTSDSDVATTSAIIHITKPVDLAKARVAAEVPLVSYAKIQSLIANGTLSTMSPTRYHSILDRLYITGTRTIVCAFCLTPNPNPTPSYDEFESMTYYTCPKCRTTLKQHYWRYPCKAMCNFARGNLSQVFTDLRHKYGIMCIDLIDEFNAADAKTCCNCGHLFNPNDGRQVYESSCKPVGEATFTAPPATETITDDTFICFGCLNDFKIDTTNSVCFCHRHGFYPGKNHKRCPICVENLKNQHCAHCGKAFTYTGNISYLLKRQENNATDDVSLCDDCKEELFTKTTTATDDDRNKPTSLSTAYYTFCEHCDDWVAMKTNLYPCPLCGSRMVKYPKICVTCGKPFMAISCNGNKCSTCRAITPVSPAAAKYNDLMLRDDITDHGDYVTLPISEEERVKNASCIICGRPFHKHVNIQLTCQHCFKTPKCPGCGKRFITSRPCDETVQYCSRACTGRVGSLTKWKNIIDNDITTFTAKATNVTYTPLNIRVDNTITNPGVWAYYDENGNLLDVHQTTNIAYEWKSLNKFKRNVFKTMRNDGIDLDNLYAIVVAYEDDQSRRLAIEEDYAITHHAKYWNPQPGTDQRHDNKTPTSGSNENDDNGSDSSDS